jgi:PHD/YefM family antitoxin component YafN of YafNO toxin-antitoxin module
VIEEGEDLMSRNVQFVTDADGNKVAVILPLEEYEEMLEDLHLSRVASESRDEERIPWSQVRAELKAEGRLDD